MVDFFQQVLGQTFERTDAPVLQCEKNVLSPIKWRRTAVGRNESIPRS